MHKNFNFDEATFIFSFVAHAFGVLSKRLDKSKVMEANLYVFNLSVSSFSSEM